MWAVSLPTGAAMCCLVALLVGSAFEGTIGTARAAIALALTFAIAGVDVSAVGLALAHASDDGSSDNRHEVLETGEGSGHGGFSK